MFVAIDRSTFDTLMNEPYGVLATYLAYRFLQQETSRDTVTQYAVYTKTGLSAPTVRKAWKRLKSLGVIKEDGVSMNHSSIYELVEPMRQRKNELRPLVRADFEEWTRLGRPLYFRPVHRDWSATDMELAQSLWDEFLADEA